MYFLIFGIICLEITFHRTNPHCFEFLSAQNSKYLNKSYFKLLLMNFAFIYKHKSFQIFLYLEARDLNFPVNHVSTVKLKSLLTLHTTYRCRSVAVEWILFIMRCTGSIAIVLNASSEGLWTPQTQIQRLVRTLVTCYELRV